MGRGLSTVAMSAAAAPTVGNKELVRIICLHDNTSCTTHLHIPVMLLTSVLNHAQ